jgi:hypothetical protein
MGPIVLFDKSIIEMLNLDEAAIFDLMFLSNLCPIYLTEVLADLEKEKPGERAREKVVADVAKKTPCIHSYPNVLHCRFRFQCGTGRYPMDLSGLNWDRNLGSVPIKTEDMARLACCGFVDTEKR